MKTSILLDHKPVPGEGHLVRLLLTLEGDPPAAGARVPLNLSLVLDRSGSMHGGKLRAAREAAAMLVRRLWPEDVVSVVAFDDEVDVVAPPATGAEHDRLSDRIRTIQPGGSTNLSGGWLKGREFVSNATSAQRTINRVMLLTDGQANVGIQDPAQLVGLCANANEGGITTTTIGFGTDYDEDLLRRMAEAGGGATYYIERIDQAASVFAEELSDLLDVAAQNLSVVVKPEAGASITMVHHSYPSAQTPEGLRLELGDLYSREPRVLLIEMLVPLNATADAPFPIATVVLTADVVGAGTVTRETVTLPVMMSPSDGAVVNATIEREALLQEAARVREQALEDRDRGDYDAARARLEEFGARARAAGMDDDQIIEEIADIGHLSDVMNPTTFGVAEAKYMKQRAYDTRRGRSKKSDMISRQRPPREP